MTTKTNYLVANEGRTLVYIIPAVLCALVSIPFFFFIIPVAILFVALTISLSLVETGLEIDLQTNKFRKYKSFFGHKWGEWSTITLPSEFDLRLSVERSFSNNAFSNVGNTNWNSGPTEIARSVTYDLSYSSEFQSHEIIYEFLDYDVAKKLVNELAHATTLPVTNHIAIKLQENMEQRMARRRR